MAKKLVEVAGCFVEFNGKFLVLKRQPDVPQGNTWGLVGGKVDVGESPAQTAVRKAKQEIRLAIDERDLRFLGEYALDYPEMAVRFFAFATTLKNEFIPTLDPKGSSDYRWVTPAECYDLPDAMDGLYVLLEKTGALEQGRLP